MNFYRIKCPILLQYFNGEILLQCPGTFTEADVALVWRCLEGRRIFSRYKHEIQRNRSCREHVRYTYGTANQRNYSRFNWYQLRLNHVVDYSRCAMYFRSIRLTGWWTTFNPYVSMLHALSRKITNFSVHARSTYLSTWRREKILSW